jgi:SAM-dependent methyltransferase
MIEEKWLNGIWQSKEYEEAKQISFKLLDSFLTKPPVNILDIGCGLAFESEEFQKKYNSNLYLLDGDFEDSKNATRDRKYGSAETMGFYSKVENLKNSFDNRKMRYNFIDANKIQIPVNLKFDLVYSNVSCGYHYPLSTYAELLTSHTDIDTIMIFDIHSRYLKEQIKDLFDVIEIKNFPDQKKIIKCKLKFKK